jgi:lipoprotein NlpI
VDFHWPKETAPALRRQTESRAIMCQAYFYAGTKHLIEGDKKTAETYFKKCLATDKVDSTEFWSAEAELKFLKAAQ